MVRGNAEGTYGSEAGFRKGGGENAARTCRGKNDHHDECDGGQPDARGTVVVMIGVVMGMAEVDPQRQEQKYPDEEARQRFHISRSHRASIV